MKKVLIISLSLFLLSSCLKKMVQVETANTNIYDTEYAGEQWFLLNDVFLYTNSANTQYVRIEYSIPRSYAPDLSPTGIKVEGFCNQYPSQLDSAVISSSGSYKGRFDYLPDGSTEFCIDIGVYINELDSSINKFSSCIDL
jgi:hypothetical protein